MNKNAFSTIEKEIEIGIEKDRGVFSDFPSDLSTNFPCNYVLSLGDAEKDLNIRGLQKLFSEMQVQQVLEAKMHCKLLTSISDLSDQECSKRNTNLATATELKTALEKNTNFKLLTSIIAFLALSFSATAKTPSLQKLMQGIKNERNNWMKERQEMTKEIEKDNLWVSHALSWSASHIKIDLIKNVSFKELYEAYTSDCTLDNRIPCSKKKFSSFIKVCYKPEFQHGAMTIENRGGVKIFGVSVIKKEMTYNIKTMIPVEWRNVFKDVDQLDSLKPLSKSFMKEFYVELRQAVAETVSGVWENVFARKPFYPGRGL